MLLMWHHLCLLCIQAIDEGILASLAELEEALREPVPVDRMEARAQRCGHHQECLYYLLTYGTHLSLICFYLRHDCLRDALTHLLSKVTHIRVKHDLIKGPLTIIWCSHS